MASLKSTEAGCAQATPPNKKSSVQNITSALTLLQMTEFSVGVLNLCVLQAEILLKSSSHELPKGRTHTWSEIMERPDAGLE